MLIFLDETNCLAGRTPWHARGIILLLLMRFCRALTKLVLGRDLIRSVVYPYDVALTSYPGSSSEPSDSTAGLASAATRSGIQQLQRYCYNYCRREEYISQLIFYYKIRTDGSFPYLLRLVGKEGAEVSGPLLSAGWFSPYSRKPVIPVLQLFLQFIQYVLKATFENIRPSLWNLNF